MPLPKPLRPGPAKKKNIPLKKKNQLLVQEAAWLGVIASDSQSGGLEFESETMERYDKFGHVYQSA